MASMYKAGVGSLVLAIDRQDIITTNSRIRDDQRNLKVWISQTSGFTPASGNLLWDAEGLSAVIPNLAVEKTHYFRYALTSALDPTIFTISSQYSFIPKASLVANTTDLPPDPLGITAVAAITSIIVTLPTPPSIPGTTQSTDYGGGDYNPSTQTTLKNTASSTHKSTVVYGKVVNSLLQTVTFSQVQDQILGEFEEKTVFTLPADPGTVYALFFKYRNKAGNLSANAQGPVMVETGINVQKFLDMLADQITEGQLFTGLQKRLARTDRVPEVDITAGQYTVKIDNGGHVAGFGLTNTNRSIGYKSDGTPTGLLSDGRPFSEFGVVADRFWISGPAIQSDTQPTTDLYHGKRWINTGTAGDNEGVIFGPTVYYNTYKPDTHNPIVFESDANYWYWELKTKTQLDKLIFSGATYVDRGTWSVSNSYAVNDYVYDKSSNVYYLCIKAYTPNLVTSFATKNPKKIGTFTGSGATFAVGKTLYIYGAERLPTSSDSGAGNNPTYKMNPDYDDKGTFYYITDVTGSEFTLSLEKGGNPVVTGIKPKVMYYNVALKSNLKKDGGTYNLDPTGGAVIDNRLEVIDTTKTGWVSAPVSSMFPFIVETGISAGVRPGIYMDAAFIKDASITNAKITTAAISSANIAYLEAGKIKGGTISADLISAGAISVNNIDIGSLRGKAVSTWTIASPTLNTSEMSRMIDLPPGDYEMILTSTFGRVDEYLGSDSVKEETATIVAEVTGVSGATVTGAGFWKKTVDSTKLEIKVANKAGTISTQPTLTVTQPTVSITNPSISVSFDLTAPESSGGGSGGGP
jgi:hypothetical protein